MPLWIVSGRATRDAANLAAASGGGLKKSVHWYEIVEATLQLANAFQLRSGLQGLRGAAILEPRRPDERPEPERLELRFAEFATAA